MTVLYNQIASSKLICAALIETLYNRFYEPVKKGACRKIHE